MCIASDEVYSNAGNFMLVSSEAVQQISLYPSLFLYRPAVRIFGEAYVGKLFHNYILYTWFKVNMFQSLLVLFAAKACKFPIWLRPLWICATWISTLF